MQIKKEKEAWCSISVWAEEKLQSASRQEFDWQPLTVTVSSSTFNEQLKTTKSLMDLAPPSLRFVSADLQVRGRGRGKCFATFLSPAFKMEETQLFMHSPLIHLPLGSWTLKLFLKRSATVSFPLRASWSSSPATGAQEDDGVLGCNSHQQNNKSKRKASSSWNSRSGSAGGSASCATRQVMKNLAARQYFSPTLFCLFRFRRLKVIIQTNFNNIKIGQ